jgi:hypothetical protein
MTVGPAAPVVRVQETGRLPWGGGGVADPPEKEAHGRKSMVISRTAEAESI